MSIAQTDILTAIAQVGFPIAVAVYLLYERTTVFKETRDQISALTATVLEVVKVNTASYTTLAVTIEKLCQEIERLTTIK